MNRRRFLQWLGAVGAGGIAVAAGLAEAQDLLTPPTKYFFAPVAGWNDNRRVVSSDDGISIRFTRAYDVTTNQFPTRFDVLYGVGVRNPTILSAANGPTTLMVTSGGNGFVLKDYALHVG